LHAHDPELRCRSVGEQVVAKVQLGRRRTEDEHAAGSAQRLHDFGKEPALIVGMIVRPRLPLRMPRDMLGSMNRRLLERGRIDVKNVCVLMIDPNCHLSVAHVAHSLSGPSSSQHPMCSRSGERACSVSSLPSIYLLAIPENSARKSTTLTTVIRIAGPVPRNPSQRAEASQ